MDACEAGSVAWDPCVQAAERFGQNRPDATSRVMLPTSRKVLAGAVMLR